MNSTHPIPTIVASQPSIRQPRGRAPLAGSIAALLAGIALALSPAAGGVAAEPGAEKAAPPAPASSSAVLAAGASDESAPKGAAAARSPEEAVGAGLAYLLKQQQSDGGWGQGGGWRQGSKGGGRVEGTDVEDPSDLGNTCVSLMALLRAGHSPAAGEHREAARKAFEYLCRQVEKAEDATLYVTAVRDTQLQVKIGTYVDTFLAGWALSELKGKAGDEAAEKRRADALNKVVAKIERNQKDDGSFADNKGWAAVLSQGLCSKALNSAARSGAKVSQGALDKDWRQNVSGLDVAKGEFGAAGAAAEPSSAGVALYRETSKLGGLREKVKSNEGQKKEVDKVLADPAAPEPKKEWARDQKARFDEDDKAVAAAQQAVVNKVGDTRYVAGFGNNGGEEFLSYMNLGESLHAQGGKEWEAWKGKMQATLCGAQNADGSWAGQHCITGRTFCTATALLTLLVERVPSAVSAVPSGGGGEPVEGRTPSAAPVEQASVKPGVSTPAAAGTETVKREE